MSHATRDVQLDLFARIDLGDEPVEPPPHDEPSIEDPSIDEPPIEQPPIDRPPIDQPPIEKAPRARASRIRDAESLRRRLEPLVPRPIASLVLTRNRTRMISAKRQADALHVRIHRCFVDAPPVVLQGVAGTLAEDSRVRRVALPVVREHFRRHGADDVRERNEPLRTRGRHHDLATLRDRVNRQYFEGAVDVDITWGRDAPGRRSRRRRAISIRLGSYSETDRLVRIHPVLDRADVPSYVVESVVHHEMLHAVVPVVPGRLRRRVHTPEFRRREREHRHFERAERWIRQNLERLDRLR